MPREHCVIKVSRNNIFRPAIQDVRAAAFGFFIITLISLVNTDIPPVIEPNEEVLEHRMIDGTRTFIMLQVSFSYVRRM